MKSNGILLQPNSTYIPQLVALMKVSGRRKKGLPYHATLESFNADLVVESEMLDSEHAAVFRSGLGLAL
jgi:cobyric acid synthase